LRQLGWAKQLHVIDLGEALRVNRLSQTPTEFGQLADFAALQDTAMALDQVKPVAAPSDVARDVLQPRSGQAHPLGFSIAGYVVHRDAAVPVQAGADDAHAGLQAMIAR